MDCMLPFVDGHVPPFNAAVVTMNICVKVPEPQLTEQSVELLHPPEQLTGMADK